MTSSAVRLVICILLTVVVGIPAALLGLAAVVASLTERGINYGLLFAGFGGMLVLVVGCVLSVAAGLKR